MQRATAKGLRVFESSSSPTLASGTALCTVLYKKAFFRLYFKYFINAKMITYYVFESPSPYSKYFNVKNLKEVYCKL